MSWRAVINNAEINRPVGNPSANNTTFAVVFVRLVMPFLSSEDMGSFSESRALYGLLRQGEGLGLLFFVQGLFSRRVTIGADQIWRDERSRCVFCARCAGALLASNRSLDGTFVGSRAVEPEIEACEHRIAGILRKRTLPRFIALFIVARSESIIPADHLMGGATLPFAIPVGLLLRLPGVGTVVARHGNRRRSCRSQQEPARHG